MRLRYKTLLNYIKQCHYGVTGIVTDSATGTPLKAKVFISGHDTDSSCIYSSSTHGNYHRMLYPGTYNLEFSAPGYIPKTIHSIQPGKYRDTLVNVQLRRSDTGINSLEIPFEIKPTLATNRININIFLSFENFVKTQVFDIFGREIINTTFEANAFDIDVSQLGKGLYILQLTNDAFNLTNTFVKVE